ncbi:15996_t:CDS:2, partial [Funneliformis mosseae]
DKEYDQLFNSSSEEERIYQSADDKRLILKEEEPIDNEEFYLNKNDRVPYDYFSASNLNDIDTNSDSEHINTKLCEHISAVTAYYRCYKIASSNKEKRSNFGSFDDIDNWFRQRNLEEHLENAMS